MQMSENHTTGPSPDENPPVWLLQCASGEILWLGQEAVVFFKVGKQDGVSGGTVVEDYPGYPKGRSVLVPQLDGTGRPIHVVWGIPKGHASPAVLVTAYRPDPKRWDSRFMERRK
jgi:hypothetical protein